MRGTSLTALAGFALLLAGCNEDMQAKAKNTDDQTADIQKVVERKLRSDIGDGMALRSVHTYSQASAETTAVCGQVRTGAVGTGAAYTLFVSIVKGEAVTDQYIGTSGPTASRVFAETITRCYEGGGPPDTRQASAPPVLPPLPDHLPAIAEATPPPPPVPALPASQVVATTTTASTPASGQVVVERNVNLRANPNGGGEVLRVLPAGSTAQILGQAPGGWLQVGDGAPWGWVHGSMVIRHSPS